MKKIHNLYHTVKHLKSTQLTNRFKRKFFKPKVVSLPSKISTRNSANSWLAVELSKTSYINENVYNFLNHSGDVTDWNDPSQEKLWLYNLHYFDDLNAEGNAQRREIHRKLINRWIAENAPIAGNGWEPYPLSLRIVNWIKWFMSGNCPELTWQQSLWQQVSVLEQDLEYHLLGNHLFANAKALVFSGCYFDGPDASRWLNTGLLIVDKELKEQILDDGGNFELTPMYHNTILADVLDLINLTFVYQHPELVKRITNWRSLAKKMLSWMNTMTHPNGDIVLFNDSANGIAATATKLNDYASQLDIKIDKCDNKVVTHLDSSGYIKISIDQQTAFLDVAKVGPDYIPGHAHADTLSFEWNYGQQRVFVNSGTSIYGTGDERLRQRKTAAHNTVVVDELDSSEVWSGFRVARRAYPDISIIESNEKTAKIVCSHDGYMRLPGKVSHERKWEMNADTFVLTDKLSGVFSTAKAHYHLHPSIKIKKNSDFIYLTLPDGVLIKLTIKGANVEILDTTWHPEFGLSIDNKKLVLSFNQPEVSLIISRVN
ncbi:alginate lyase family protein [Vibrio sp. SCSIO 43132]|uniref:heparinase II/III family protein n=1 Tax=Vibrio sp. SCSIO 43132 TaxID=2779363 RepID=UPI001CA855FF|nr:heparinase II/III family protein [Vibrio sp. SCSIO 43132]UAB70548.1 alginate lyase family protein [Vibrio sp. SCSIO 43132]